MGVFDPPTAGTPGSTAPGVMDAVVPADRVVGQQGDIVHNVFGFFTNAFRDLKDIGSGLATVGGAVLHDVRTAEADFNPFEADRPEGYITDNIAQAALGIGKYKQAGSALWNDYQSRYGAMAKGDVTEGFQQLYQHPLGFLSDALTVVTAGGWGAAKGASIAGKLGLAGGVAEGAAVVGAAGAVEASANAAGDLGRVAKLVETIKGSVTPIYNSVSGAIEAVDPLANPARRMLSQDPFLSLVTKHPSYFASKAEKFAEMAGQGGPKAAEYLLQQEKYQKIADETIRLGADSAFRPGYANSLARKVIDKLVGASSSKATDAAVALDKSFVEHFGKLPDHIDDNALVDAFTDSSHPLTRDGIVPPVGKGLRRAEQFQDFGPESLDTGAARWADSPSTTGKGFSVDSSQSAGVQDHFMVNGPEGSYTSVERTGEGDAYSMKAASVPESLRGQGRGTALYRATAAEVERRGGTLVSDRSLTADARRVWDAAVKRGDAQPLQDGGYQWTGGALTDARVPGVGAATRDELTAAWESANGDLRTITPKLRDEFGTDAHVTFAAPKAEQAIRRKAELLGDSWRGVDDISRPGRIVLDNVAEPGVLESTLARIKKATGDVVVKVENTFARSDADGSRMMRVVMKAAKDGHPYEIQVVSRNGAKVLDASEHLRSILSTLAAQSNRGMLSDDLLRFEKGKRLLQQLWEGESDAVREALGGPKASELRKRINGYRVDLFATTTDKLLQKGLDISSAFDNAFLTMRKLHGAKYDPKLGGYYGGPSPLELDEGIAKAGDMAPLYYPMMDEHLLPKRGDFMMRGARTTSSAMHDQNLMRNTGKLLHDAAFSKDARTVYRIRATQAARMQEKMDILFETVAQYGRPLKNINDYNPATEELFAPGLIKRLVGQHNALMDELTNDPEGKGLGDLMRKLTANNSQEAADLYNTAGDIETFAVPKVVAQRLRQHAGWLPKDVKENIDIVFGTPTQMWRTAVLTGSPRWVLNNMVGNVAFLKLQGGRLTDVVRQLNPQYLSKLREAIGPEALQRIEGGLFHSEAATARRFSDDSAVGRFATAMQQKIGGGTRVGRGLEHYTHWVQSVNSGMEDAFRRASYMTAADRAVTRTGVETAAHSFWKSKQRLENSFRAGLTEKEWHKAVDEVNKTMNDYSAATPMARNILKPYLVPFWSFYRHATKTLLVMPFEHPAKANLLRILGDTEDERLNLAGATDMPGWMKGTSLFLGKGEAGDYRFMSTAGANPFNSVLDTPLNLLHPLWKMAYEQSTGRSTFTGRPFTDANTVTSFGSDQQYQVEHGQMQPVDAVRPGLLEHALQQLPQYNMLKDIIAGGTTYDTTNLLSVLAGRLTGQSTAIIDPTTGAPVSPKGLLDQLSKLFGFADPFSQDLNKLAAQRLSERQAAMAAWLKRRGVTAPAPASGSGGVFDAA